MRLSDASGIIARLWRRIAVRRGAIPRSDRGIPLERRKRSGERPPGRHQLRSRRLTDRRAGGRSTRRNSRRLPDRTRARRRIGPAPCAKLVRKGGLEPPRVAPLAPKASASTGSATFALANGTRVYRAAGHGLGSESLADRSAPLQIPGKRVSALHGPPLRPRPAPSGRPRRAVHSLLTSGSTRSANRPSALMTCACGIPG